MTAPGVIRKRSIVVAGHKTSLSVEEIFWDSLKLLAAEQGLSLNALVSAIDRERPGGGVGGNLSSAVRVYVIERLRARAGLGGATGPDP
jgi:predicted DNA-binding ribbon-helix-helix protein